MKLHTQAVLWANRAMECF